MASAMQAQEYLEKQGYTLPDMQGGKAALSYTLWGLAHCMPSAILPKSLRAVAIILEHKEASNVANTIVAAVMHKLDPLLDLMDHAANVMQVAVKDTRMVVDWLYRTGEEMRDELQKGIELVKEDLQKLVEDIKDKVSKLTRLVTAAASNMGIAQYNTRR